MRSLAHGDHRIEQPRKVGMRIHGVRGIERRIDAGMLSPRVASDAATWPPAENPMKPSRTGSMP